MLVLGIAAAACSSSPPTATVAAEPAATATAVPPTASPVPTVVPTATVFSLADAAELMKRYTTLVWITDSRGRLLGNGTGVSLGAGKVLTNYHVVEGAREVWVRFADGRRDSVDVVHADPRRDLALLQASFVDEPAAEIGDSRSLRLAESLLAAGYPRMEAIGAQDITITRGIFSGLKDADGVWHVQTDAPVNPGNSGGPLADSQGRVIGIVRLKIRNAEGLNFAIASDEVQAFLNTAATKPEPLALRPAPPAVAPAPTSPPVAQRAPTSSPTPSLASDGPTDAVRAFYGAISAHNLEAAWALLGPSFRAKNKYDGWAKGFATTRAVRVSSARTTSASGDAAVVEFTIVATDAAASGTVDKTFQGTWTLKRIDGAWKLDVPSIRQVS
ncbi:MAG TPA: trypsin-like peptidase domain-containing protein [Chloroflexota bacterium]|nr:trypsin-like peptidase domain-containing protein [Chloroflexota bacterium]